MIYVLVPYLLKSKKFVERDNLKWIVWLGSFPVFGVIIFFDFFVGEKAYCYINLPNIFGWLGITLMFWLIMIPIVFLGRSFGKHVPPWEVSPSEASDNAGDLFEMALKIGKEKREGKDTSELLAEYEQKVKNFEETGSLVSSDDAQFYADDLFDMAMKIGKEKREGKDTSKQEAEYNRKVESLEKNGYLDEH
ncbi:MAG: hypothetical protein IK012_09495 [Fibrobacter sp.]|uniref:hypothetical protein n=1 Tax=Fibrobacter sp. TaxID=35828 RepID=UPI0025C22867|nr:hypothetical protein [Fibrobacter sp.]MBR4785467.1 hypothetical protein [Fibrobacter sp.]